MLALLKQANKFFLVVVLLCISCVSNNKGYQKNIVIAVWDFDNLTPSANNQHDLGEFLSSQVIEALKERGDIYIVERERLLLALEELNLGTTSLVDEGTRLKLGRLSGAQMMVFGSYQVIGDQMRLDLRLVEVETGKVRKAVQKITSATDLSEWLNSAREAAGELF
jgi:curli biogenesis system outer membrane secretion channel CsgG